MGTSSKALIILSIAVILNATITSSDAFARSSKAKAGQIGFILNYSSHSAEYTTFTSPEKKMASGTGYGLGVELQAATRFQGLWTLGVLYTSQTIEFTPDQVKEVLEVRSVEVPITWGVVLASHLYLGLGLTVKSGLDKLRRTRGGQRESMTHNEYGLNALQTFITGVSRFMLPIRANSKVFVDLRYSYGLLDRALGADEFWQDSQMSLGGGFVY